MWYLIPQAFQSGLPDLQDNQRSKPQQTFSSFQLLSFTAIQRKNIFLFLLILIILGDFVLLAKQQLKQ